MMLIMFINLGSTAAPEAVLSLSTVGLYLSYLMPISFFMVGRWRGTNPTDAPFRLGRWGTPINLFALSFGHLHDHLLAVTILSASNLGHYELQWTCTSYCHHFGIRGLVHDRQEEVYCAHFDPWYILRRLGLIKLAIMTWEE